MAVKRARIPSYGRIVGSSLTGSYQSIKAFDDNLMILILLSGCDKDIIVSLDGGTTDHLFLEANERIVLDFSAGSTRLVTPNIMAKHAGAAPTSGSVRVTGVI